MKETWEIRWGKIKGLFEEGFMELFLEEHDFIQEIVFFGSFMKGKNHRESDLDIILIPTSSFAKETKEDSMGWIETLFGLHEDLREGLVENIPLDVKIQEFHSDQEQYGWTFRTGNTLATFYSFIKGEVGETASVKEGVDVSFSII